MLFKGPLCELVEYNQWSAADPPFSVTEVNTHANDILLPLLLLSHLLMGWVGCIPVATMEHKRV